MPTLVIREKPDHRIDIFHFSDSIDIGKDPSNHIVLTDPGVSRFHARIVKAPAGTYIIEDKGSTNGTWMGDHSIDRADLSNGSTFRIRNYVFTLFVDSRRTEKRIIPKSADSIEGELAQMEHKTQWIVEKAPDSASPMDPPSHAGGSHILEVINELMGILHLPDLLNQALDASLDLIHAQRGLIVLKTDGQLEVACHRRFPENLGSLPVSKNTIHEVIEMGCSILVHDAGSERNSNSVYIYDLKSILCVPLKTRDRTIGCIYLDNPSMVRSFSRDDQQVLKIFAGLIAIAMENARLYDQVVSEKRQLEKRIQNTMGKKNGFVFASEKMQRIYRSIRKIAPYRNLPVLIIGETGTGKECVAQTIHEFSKSQEFVAVNCAEMSAQLFESELFGHVKGAFTGADKNKMGLFELANGGTLFLDEISEMKPELQAKLLRAIQEGVIKRVGGMDPIDVDVHVIAATNQNIQDPVVRRQVQFRNDLFYRLEGTILTIPPLRDRKEDIPVLAQHFIDQFLESGRQEPKKFSPKAMELLQNYSWPGNVRELKNAVYRAAVNANTTTIHPRDLPETIQLAHPKFVLDQFPSLQEMEKEHIRKALELTNWNKKQTYQMLGIAKETLRRKIKEYQIRRSGNS